MIQLSELSKSFGDRVLLERVTWKIGDRERVGLCGPNGAGKTTLLRILARLEEADSGNVILPTSLTVGYLPQDGLTHSGRTLFEETSTALQYLLDIKTEMHKIEHELGNLSLPKFEHDAMLERYSELQDRFRILDGYSIDLRVTTILHGLGFTHKDLNRLTETFSGGWQMRIALAKLLLRQPSLLLLDEPTNHLDLDARNWLEHFLTEYPHAVLLISHDRYFLDTVVTRITDLNLYRLIDYPGNYTKFIVARDAMMNRLRQEKHEQDEEVSRIKAFIDRFRYQATKASQVQSRVKLLKKIVPIEVPPERKRIHFNFPNCAKSGRTVLELSRVQKRYPELTVFNDIQLHIDRGDRIALIGPNGAGKSTLMRMLSGNESPDSGTLTLGHNVIIEYFAQDEASRMDPSLTVHETLQASSMTETAPMIRTILGGFLFSGDDVYKKVRVLSGGERTRLAVARMLLRPSNTLLLDEPTNHLDLESKDVLLEALEDYGGTLIFVSHDRYFVEKLATKIIEVGKGQAISYPGTYNDFLWRKEQEATLPAHSLTTKNPGSRLKNKHSKLSVPKNKQPTQTGQEPLQNSWKIKKKLDSESRKKERAQKTLLARIADIESRIAVREAEVKTIEIAMSADGFYDDLKLAKPILDRHQALMWEVGDLLAQWETLHNHTTREKDDRE